jgi:hypothetical protein
LKKNAEFWWISQLKKRSFVKQRRKWEDNNKYDLSEIECGDGSMRELNQGRAQLQIFEYVINHFIYTKCMQQTYLGGVGFTRRTTNFMLK